MSTLSKSCLERCHKLGFTKPYLVDVTKFGSQAARGLSDYINADHHGTMAWLEETQERRGHPLNLWPDAKTAIIVGLNYGPDSDPLLTLEQHDKATISVYARNKDYHNLIKGKLKEFAGLIARDTDQDVKVFVDTAPLMEKPLAAAAGLGGKESTQILLAAIMGHGYFWVSF